MSKIVAGFRHKAMYQKIGLILLLLIAAAVLVLCCLALFADFRQALDIAEILLAISFFVQSIIYWKENKILAVMELVVAVIFTAILIIGFIL